VLPDRALLEFHYLTWKVIYWLRDRLRVRGSGLGLDFRVGVSFKLLDLG